jgi:hypothetical protein
MNEEQVVWTRVVVGFGVNCVEPSDLATRELVTITDEDVSGHIMRRTVYTYINLLIIEALISMARVTRPVRPIAEQ